MSRLMETAKHTMFPVSTPGESVRLLTENEVGSSPTLGAKIEEGINTADPLRGNGALSFRIMHRYSSAGRAAVSKTACPGFES